MRKKILILGANGMAGHILVLHFRGLNDKYEVLSIARNQSAVSPDIILDVSDFTKIQVLIKDYNPDFIVNAIGILNQDAEGNPDKAILINSYLPHFLESITKDKQTKIIHISTDCVFSGSRGNYLETDFKDGKGFYAQSKALGEIFNNKDITIRTSIIGPELNKSGIGLFNWFMSQDMKSLLKGYSKAFWSGITTIELAKVVEDVIEKKITGIIHVTSGEKISKYKLLNLFNEVYRDNRIIINEEANYEVDKSLVSSRKDYIYKVPSYKTMLVEMREWIDKLGIYHY